MTNLSDRPFEQLANLISECARRHPGKTAVIYQDTVITYARFDRLVARVAAALQRHGVKGGDVVALCAMNSAAHAIMFFGILRAGACIATLPISQTADTLKLMLDNCQARLCLFEAGDTSGVGAVASTLGTTALAFNDIDSEATLPDWVSPEDIEPKSAGADPEDKMIIIYSSGTTGTPKGIVHSYGMRWRAVQTSYFAANSITLLTTPLYSNTTLIGFIPTLTLGGTLILTRRFDVGDFLTLSERHRVTHAVLVPVQYRRILEDPSFPQADLSSYVTKICTSAPFAADLKRRALDMWPGELIEYYGATEGGGAFVLLAHKHRDKLHTVGHPIEGHEVKLLDENDREVAPGQPGEVVGRSNSMMTGYYRRDDLTKEMTWVSPDGGIYYRNGDIGRFDADGFLTLVDRKKDVIISGGFNIYPSDIEPAITAHPDVADVSVVGVTSDRWGETPVAFVVRKANSSATAEDIMAFANQSLGKTQRVSDLRFIDTLPRNAIGKVLKRELKAQYAS